ncbi:hypothetical protein SAMN05660657_05378 [Geodermatophilus amargosae]|uniref:Uncharacterized protein n=1 Tax=Geodermatophilus amargosae TaxID=1296565 RepID=A0A1I7D6K4_9ACTN|nr:hypothetical protein [Geodermatophilus amargosae]SFU07348.1 hypothetical protein SAMN05660657_05378 [Geodermatophilus amargosae]
MVLRKLKRSPAKLDGLELFRQLDDGGQTPLRDPARLDAVLQQVGEGVQEALAAPSTVHGWRAQALFASLVVALDGCELLMTLDSGEVFVDGDDVKLPDYLLVLRDGRRLLVEVKNVAPTKPTGPVTMSAAEMNGLRRFRGLHGGEVHVACLFSTLGQWALVPADAFGRDERGRYVLGLEAALMANRLSETLGDVMVGLVPPLRLDLIADPSKPRHVAADGEAQFELGEVQLWAGGQQMVEEDESRLAMFLLRFGSWPAQQEADLDGDLLRKMSLVCAPEEPTPGQGFEIIGNLSSMFARWFEAATRDGDELLGLQVPVDPGVLRDLLPAEFSSPRLPLWRFRLVPTEPHEKEPDSEPFPVVASPAC